MEKISELIKEAKPLYYERKKTRTRIKRACFSLAIIMTVLGSGFGGYAIKSYTTNYIANSETTTESYLPVDEYGLITVAY